MVHRVELVAVFAFLTSVWGAPLYASSYPYFEGSAETQAQFKRYWGILNQVQKLEASPNAPHPERLQLVNEATEIAKVLFPENSPQIAFSQALALSFSDEASNAILDLHLLLDSAKTKGSVPEWLEAFIYLAIAEQYQYLSVRDENQKEAQKKFLQKGWARLKTNQTTLSRRTLLEISLELEALGNLHPAVGATSHPFGAFEISLQSSGLGPSDLIHPILIQALWSFLAPHAEQLVKDRSLIHGAAKQGIGVDVGVRSIPKNILAGLRIAKLAELHLKGGHFLFAEYELSLAMKHLRVDRLGRVPAIHVLEQIFTLTGIDQLRHPNPSPVAKFLLQSIETHVQNLLKEPFLGQPRFRLVKLLAKLAEARYRAQPSQEHFDELTQIWSRLEKDASNRYHPDRSVAEFARLQKLLLLVRSGKGDLNLLEPQSRHLVTEVDSTQRGLTYVLQAEIARKRGSLKDANQSMWKALTETFDTEIEFLDTFLLALEIAKELELTVSFGPIQSRLELFRHFHKELIRITELSDPVFLRRLERVIALFPDQSPFHRSSRLFLLLQARLRRNQSFLCSLEMQ